MIIPIFFMYFVFYFLVNILLRNKKKASKYLKLGAILDVEAACSNHVTPIHYTEIFKLFYEVFSNIANIVITFCGIIYDSFQQNNNRPVIFALTFL